MKIRKAWTGTWHLRRLVQGMAAKVWVEGKRPGAGCNSRPGPFKPSPTVGRQRKESMKESAKILLVDDEPAISRYIRICFEVDDYKVRLLDREEALLRVAKAWNRTWYCSIVLMPGIEWTGKRWSSFVRSGPE